MTCGLSTRLPGARNVACLVSFLVFTCNGSSGMLRFLVGGFAEDAGLQNFTVLPSTGDLRISTSSDNVISASIDACTGKVITHANAFTLGDLVITKCCSICRKWRICINTKKHKNNYKHHAIMWVISPSGRAQKFSGTRLPWHLIWIQRDLLRLCNREGKYCTSLPISNMRQEHFCYVIWIFICDMRKSGFGYVRCILVHNKAK